MQRAADAERESLVARLGRVEQAGPRRHCGNVKQIGHKDLTRTAPPELSQELGGLCAGGWPLGTAQPALAPLAWVKTHALDLLSHLLDRAHQLLALLHFRQQATGVVQL